MTKLLGINIILITTVFLNSFISVQQSLPPEIQRNISVLKDNQKVEYLSKLCWSNREKQTELALEYAKYGLKLADSLQMLSDVARLNNYIGVIYLHYLHNNRSSISYFHKALATSLQANDSIQIAYSYNNLGDAFYLTGNTKFALEYGERSLHYFSELNNNTGIAYSYINLGLANRLNKDYDKSIEYFKSAIDIRKPIGDSIGIASGLYEIAESYFKKGNYTLAKYYYNKSLKLHNELENKMYIALNLNGLGDISFVHELYEDALSKYDEALMYNQAGKRKRGIIDNNLGRALVFSKLGRRKDGEEALNKAHSLARELGYASNILNAFETRAEFYANVGDYELSNTSYRKYIVIYDSLFTIEQQETLAEMQHNFLITQNLNKITNDLEIKKKEILILVIAVIVFIFLGLALIWKYISNSRLNKKLKQINDSKDKLFSIISHDLKSPFNSILGLSELIVKSTNEQDFEKTKKFSNYILQQSKQTVSLIDNLTSWSTSQRGTLKINKEVFSLFSLLEEIRNMNNIAAKNKNIDIKLELDKQLIVHADKKILTTVFTNLSTNAIKFTPASGLIVISAIKKPKSVELMFKDSGVGIKEEDISRLFNMKENFTTPGTEDEKGTGLGLIICKEFIELHGGNIDVESKLGEGATFKISLPQ